MNYKDYKQQKLEEMKFEEKARSKVNGFWSFLSYALSYKLKELLFTFLIFSFSTSVLFIINPEWAKFLHDKVVSLIK